MNDDPRDAKIAKLERQIARDKAEDRRARVADACSLLRQAIQLLDTCIEPTAATTRAAKALADAADAVLEVV